MPYDSPAGLATDQSGPAVAPANLSARQAKERGLLTIDTCGQPFTGSSSSAALQSSLASRLRAKLQMTGSTLYRLTWKDWGLPSGRSLSRLRASVPRTSGTGLTGWVTPSARDWKDSPGMSTVRKDGRIRMDQCHIHKASQRAIREGKRPEYYATVCTDYWTLDGALCCLCHNASISGLANLKPDEPDLFR